MVAVFYAISGMIFIPIVLIASVANPLFSVGLGFALALPIIYGLFGFVVTAIACLVYNLVAGWVGGIEIEVVEAGPMT